MLWEVDIHPSEGQPDVAAEDVMREAGDLGFPADLRVASARGYLLEGKLNAEHVRRLTTQLLADSVVERTVIGPVGDAELVPEIDKRESTGGDGRPDRNDVHLVHVLPKPGVTDPVAESAAQAMADIGIPVQRVRTFRKYWLSSLPESQVELLCNRMLANESIEQLVVGPLDLDHLDVGSTYVFERVIVAIRELDGEGLDRLSREGQLYLTRVEMDTIQAYFRQLDRDPTDVELESIAQTWSEHCSHKTLAGRIRYRDGQTEIQFENMLKETIFAATRQIRQDLGEEDWCVSVFQDNAGIVRFDDEDNVVFKVETHNHPSALEPYGGANTGIGGVIRDPMGTGMGAKPICNTDVFCFAPPDTSIDDLPPGVLHPRRVMRGVVAGVRDYGNRMGIPTVNGAVYFDPRYLGNPLVYCGTVGILPREHSFKEPRAGDLIVAVGGRTGRDGIHGATFSSAELTSDSEMLSGGAVQIGNAITEKMLLDVILEARDRGLYHAITDCGAGGFSSAVGEMGEKIGAEVWLDKAPLKYEGLSYTEIWISEAQERMVLAVPEEHWAAFDELCRAEAVEAVCIGRFVETGRLELKYKEHTVADLDMAFLHDGRPPVVRDAVFHRPELRPLEAPSDPIQFGHDLHELLRSLNVASKEWVVRQYDHEVQAGSVVKPLVGIENDGPGDAAVVRPKLGSACGLAISCGMNPHYGSFDTYSMAASAMDEAIRNGVAVGADPDRIAILDNFCWGYTDRPETLGSLVRAALACRDLAVALGTPFVSGKDSLNNEFSFVDSSGDRQTIAIPPSLLISAIGQVPDVHQCVTMDLKEPGNRLYQVGQTYAEMGGSHFSLIHQLEGGRVPSVDARQARRTFRAIHQAIHAGNVRSCHDLSEGGLAVALAEMAFAGGLGADVVAEAVPVRHLELPDSGSHADTSSAPPDPDSLSSKALWGPEWSNDPLDPQVTAALFAESNTRFVCEVAEQYRVEFEALLTEMQVPWGHLGVVTEEQQLVVRRDDGQDSKILISEEIASLKRSWQRPLNWQ